MRFIAYPAVLLLAQAAASAASAQPASSCRPPASIAAPHGVAATDSDPVRREAVSGYTLALTWAPEYCHGAARRAKGGSPDLFECSGAFAGRFVLHGLWPDGARPDRWPQYCRPTGVLPQAVLRANICLTPSVQLMQHEWAKHGSCMAQTPEAYFAAAARAYGAIVVPDMRPLSANRGLRVADLRRAFAAANASAPPEAFRIGLNTRGWLEEVRLCLGLQMRPRACPASAADAAPDARVRIELGARPPRSSRFRDDGDRDGGG